MTTTLNNYTLGRTLGSGFSCKVKMAKDAAGTRYAIKILRAGQSFDQLVETEVTALAALQHPNIVGLVEVGEGVVWHPRKGGKTVKYIVLELVGGGELYDLVSLGGSLTEPQARHYFKQLLDGLSFMHSHGFAHRDLKPENLLLDNEFNLKITDLGLAAPVHGRDGSGLLQTKLGTASYMAPEVHFGEPYQGPVVDIFACAIILFVIVTHRPPFSSATPQDPHYRLIAAQRAEIFWQAHAEAGDGTDIFSAEFKDLFEQMMQLNPSKRPTIQQILEHPWMAGPVPTNAEIVTDFTRRQEAVFVEAHREREAKRQMRREAQSSRTVHRSGNNDEEESERPREAWERLEVAEYGPYFMQDFKQFFMSSQPLDYFERLVEYLHAQKVVYKISGSSLRLEYETRLGDDATGAEEQKKALGRLVKVDIQVLRVTRNKCCVKLTYKDPTTKVDLTTELSETIMHFMSVRDAPSLRMFCDTTFTE